MCYAMLSHFSRVWLLVTLGTVAHQAPLSMGFSRQEYWSGLPIIKLMLLLLIQSRSRVQLFVTPWIAAYQASLFFNISWGLFKLMSIELVMLSNHLIFCHPHLLLPSIIPSIKVFSNESALCIRWPNYWSFSISPSNEYPGLISLGLTGLISLQSKGLSRVFSNTTVQKHQFFGAQISL